MKILLFLAKGFETMEASVFIDVPGWARSELGLDLGVVTCGFTRQVVSTFGVPVTVDTLIDEVQVKDYDALAIPGGFSEYGFYEEAYDERFLQLIRDFDQAHKWIASICVGALPVGKSGVLKNRRATTYNKSNGRRQKQLRDLGAEIVQEPIVTDENIITSYGPATAAGVALLLLEKLTGQRDAAKIRELMGF